MDPQYKEQYGSFIRNRVTQLRIDKNISEYSLSHALGRSKGYIQSITSGKSLPSIDGLADICDYFELSFEDFFATSKDTFPPIMQRAMKELQKVPETELPPLIEVIKRFQN